MIIRLRSTLFPALILMSLLIGCSATRPGASGWGGRIDDSTPVPTRTPTPVPAHDSADTRAQLLDILSTELHTWMGTPHVWGGTTLQGVDCSGLIQTVFSSALNLQLPRTTSELKRFGTPIKRSELQTGDLVFFKPKGSGNHVGIYLTDAEFVHASSSRGVMQSSLNDAYWNRYYEYARRVFTTRAQLTDAVAYAHRMQQIRLDFQGNRTDARTTIR